ncbi:MAG: protein kinase [Cyanophyceae cyanobacterium]
MPYCINPNCPIRENPDGVERCQDCNNLLHINGRYWLVRPLRDLDTSPYFEIFQADDCQQKQPKVLKSLKSSQSKYRELFEQEAEILIRSRHPGIPRAELGEYFTVELNNGQRLQCLAMEKIAGQDLEKWVQKHGRISQDMALRWLKQLAEILGYVHQQELFHRDIKPANIMRKPDGQLVLIDFGTAREMTTTVVAGQTITAVHSLGYTAPEQIEGRAVPQSDFFALGRTFVRLLTGKQPHELKTRWQDSASQISAPLANLIDRLMAQSVENRPQDTHAIRQRLEEIERSLSEPSPSPPPAFRPWLTIGLTIGGVLIGIGIRPYIEKLPGVFSSLNACEFPADNVSAMDFSPDGQYLAAASLDTTVRVLDVASDACYLESHTSGVVAIQFSPEQSTLATASLDATARLWQIDADGIVHFKTFWHSSPVVALDFSPEGQYLATASADGVVKVWETASGEQMARLDNPTYVTAVSFSATGKYLAVAKLNHQAQVWEWQGLHSNQLVALPQQDVVDVAFSPKDEQYLATASADGTAQVWNITNSEEVAHLQYQTGLLTIRFSPNGQYIATTSSDNKAQLWEWPAHRYDQKAIFLPQDNVADVAFSSTGKNLATAGADGTAKVWQTNGNEVAELSDQNNLVTVDFDPANDNYLALASTDGTVEIEKWKHEANKLD